MPAGQIMIIVADQSDPSILRSDLIKIIAIKLDRRSVNLKPNRASNIFPTKSHAGAVDQTVEHVSLFLSSTYSGSIPRSPYHYD